MRKLIERQQTSIITCDNPDCDYIEPYTDETDLALFIDKQCPKCGDQLLTPEDYLLHKKLTKNINFINRWFSWITIFYPKKRLDSSDSAIKDLNKIYPNAELLVSTMGTKNYTALEKLLEVSIEIQKVGLQFSVHEAFDYKRDELIPFKNKLNLREIRDFGIEWNRATKRPVYINVPIIYVRWGVTPPLLT